MWSYASLRTRRGVSLDCKAALTAVRVLAERGLRGLLHAHGTIMERRYTLRNDAP